MKSLEDWKEDYAHSIGYKSWEECINDQPNYKVESLMDKMHQFYRSQSVQQALEEAEEAKQEIISEYEKEIEHCQGCIDYSSDPKVIIQAKSKIQAYRAFIIELKSIKTNYTL